MQKKNLISTTIFLLCSLAILSYIVTKATVSSFTHDESFSYMHFVHYSFMDIISHVNPYSNNHLLNSLLMKYSEILFGSSEIALRLPNLIMLAVFFIYLFLLFKEYSQILFIGIFILICTNWHLIDFFGLARGYGLSIGFMTMSLYHLIQSFNTNKNKHLICFNLCALLAILSNFTMLNFYIAGILVFNFVKFLECRFVINEKYNLLKSNKINLILFGVLLIVLYEPVRRVIKFNSLDFGGKNGFVSDTISSLINISFGNTWIDSLEMKILQAVFLVLILIPLFIISRKIILKDDDFFKNAKSLTIVNLILVVILLETLIQHYFFNTDYLIGRFSLFLYPLFVLNVAFLLEYLFKGSNLFLKIGMSIVYLLALLSAVKFYSNINLYSCGEWSYDKETKNVMKQLIVDYKSSNSNQDKIKLGVNTLFKPTANFYIETLHINWLLPTEKDSATNNDNYYYIFNSDLQKLNLKNYKVIFSSPETKSRLIKNNE